MLYATNKYAHQIPHNATSVNQLMCRYHATKSVKYDSYEISAIYNVMTNIGINRFTLLAYAPDDMSCHTVCIYTTAVLFSPQIEPIVLYI